jgi:ATP-dependent Clp endopeptidase proteolytic subunit ClpP
MTIPKKSKKTRKKKIDVPDCPEDESSTAEESPELPPFPIIFNMDSLTSEEPKEKLRTIALYGTIKEDVCAEVIYSLIILERSGKSTFLEDPDDAASKEKTTYEPIKFIISSYGGSAADMFSVYDTMRNIRDHCEIHTQGLGKVMSAAVLLLAAGTKGQRTIGKHTRVMIHGVIAGQHGHISDLENEMEEAKWTQGQYIKALAKETNMSQKYIKKLIDKKMNVYLNAQEAVDLGIADIIV